MYVCVWCHAKFMPVFFIIDCTDLLLCAFVDKGLDDLPHHGEESGRVDDEDDAAPFDVVLLNETGTLLDKGKCVAHEVRYADIFQIKDSNGLGRLARVQLGITKLRHVNVMPHELLNATPCLAHPSLIHLSRPFNVDRVAIIPREAIIMRVAHLNQLKIRVGLLQNRVRAKGLPPLQRQPPSPLGFFHVAHAPDNVALVGLVRVRRGGCLSLSFCLCCWGCRARGSPRRCGQRNIVIRQDFARGYVAAIVLYVCVCVYVCA